MWRKEKEASLEKQGRLGKAKAKAKSKLGKVCKRNLEKMGKLSLQEKVQQAAEAAEDPEEQAEQLQKNPFHWREKGSLGAKHNTFLKHNPLEKGDHNQLSKKDKGIAACLWVSEGGGEEIHPHQPDCQGFRSLGKGRFLDDRKASLGQVWWKGTQPPHWEWKGGLQRRPLHLQCLPVQRSPCLEKKVQVNRGKKWQSGQEYEPEEEDLEKFKALYDEDAMNLDQHEISQLEGRAKGSGKTSGKHLGKGKTHLGKGKTHLGKGKGKGAKEKQLAIKDKEPDEEDVPEDEALKDALKKVRKARDSVSAAISNLEEALGKAKVFFVETRQSSGWRVHQPAG